MIYLSLYVIGAIIAVCVAGFLNRGNTLSDDECQGIAAAIFLWPLVVAAVIVIGTPVLLFAICKGELDSEIKQGCTWIKAKWNSLGD